MITSGFISRVSVVRSHPPLSNEDPRTGMVRGSFSLTDVDHPGREESSLGGAPTSAALGVVPGSIR
jgi:hypothetical protein